MRSVINIYPFIPFEKILINALAKFTFTIRTNHITIKCDTFIDFSHFGKHFHFGFFFPFFLTSILNDAKQTHIKQHKSTCIRWNPLFFLMKPCLENKRHIRENKVQINQKNGKGMDKYSNI